MSDHPIFWTFRRCPYAMRARLALVSAGVTVELREILLRDKPDAFLATSPSATVPALRVDDTVIDESRDIMIWALEQCDPEGLLDMPDNGWDLITRNDGPFKAALDHTKYAVRHPELDPAVERTKAGVFLSDLDARLSEHNWLFGDRATIADYALLPFVRQFANIDRAAFDANPWPNLIGWLDRFLASETFAAIMTKYDPWTPDAPPVWFGRP
ncbi:MAG: glutathione S-transferase [Pseudomonadota bacterium]